MSKKILIVEDNILNLKLTKKLISLAGMHPLTAFNAEDGIMIARSERPDLILMDIQLPGINGLDATRIIKNDPGVSSIPIIALSAHAMQEEMDKAREAGCDGYITKPLDTRTFLKTIQGFLIQESGQDEERTGKKPEGSLKPRILLADADPENRRQIKAFLSGMGAEIINAAGESGIAASMTVFPDSIDLLIIGSVIPEKDRFETARRFRADPAMAEIPILAITSTPFETEAAWDAGADAIIGSPINQAELMAKVGRFLFTKNPELCHAGYECIMKGDEDSAKESVILFIGMDEKSVDRIMSSLDDEKNHRALMYTDARDAIEYVMTGHADVICSPAVLQDSDAVSLCRSLKSHESTSCIQILILSKNLGAERRIMAINAGCDDYIEMPVSLAEMSARLKALLKKKKELDAMGSRIDSAMNSSITDRLTGLYSYSYFRHYLDMELKRSIRQGSRLSILIIEINDFGRYTETHGEEAAEREIKRIANILIKNIRAVDFPSRFSIHRLAVILPNTDEKDADLVSGRIMTGLYEAVACDDEHTRISFGHGIAVCPDDAIDSISLIHKANSRLMESNGELGSS